MPVYVEAAQKLEEMDKASGIIRQASFAYINASIEANKPFVTKFFKQRVEQIELKDVPEHIAADSWSDIVNVQLQDEEKG